MHDAILSLISRARRFMLLKFTIRVVIRVIKITNRIVKMSICIAENNEICQKKSDQHSIIVINIRLLSSTYKLLFYANNMKRLALIISNKNSNNSYKF